MSLRPILPLLKLCAAIAAGLLLIDVLLFRSGFYYAWVEPLSTAGSVTAAMRFIPYSFDAGRKNILVLGNSQIGEGFSAPSADATAARADLHFINGAVAGTTPRVWFYLLRAIDPDADRFAAVALMVDYDLLHQQQELRNYELDVSYTVPLLHLADLRDYPASFGAVALRERARRAILLPLHALQDDALGILSNPLRRINEVREYWPAWLPAASSYSGHNEALPAVTIDSASGQPVDWGQIDASLKPKLEAYFNGLRTNAAEALQQSNDAYQRDWLGRIADRYAARGVPVILFVVPRGPWGKQLLLPPQERGAVAELAASRRAQTLPADAFVECEQPQYFFDTLHMNHEGRELFSRRFAQLVAPRVH